MPAQETDMANLLEDLKLLVHTRHSLVTIQTMEEVYATRLVREIGKDMCLAVLEWSISDGLHPTVPGDSGKIQGADTLLGALKHMRGNTDINLYVLKDATKYVVDDAATERMLRDVATEYAGGSRTIFMIDPSGKLPDSLHTLAVPFDLALPDNDEIHAIVRQTYLKCNVPAARVEMTHDEFDQFLASLRGLTRGEIAQVVMEAVLNDGKLDAADIAVAVEAKRRRLQQTGVLDFIPPPEAAPSVGGMKNLHQWLTRRAKAFSPKAEKFGLEPPRGILMLGVQGCGKSLMARFVAAQWKMPLLRMDVGALYDKYVGESERRLRQAFEVASVMAPCVLWIDEIEKAFASSGAGADAAAADAGLSQRLFGQLLTWLQEPKSVFIVATANDVSALPPELMRKGRFDEIFFVDLPDAEARKEIFRIHLTRRKRDPANFDLEAVAAAGDGFSGAELEQALVSAMYAAFNEDREVMTKDILAELAGTRPLSVVMAEKVQALRAWAADRCVRAD
jgi:hypothetical protein